MPAVDKYRPGYDFLIIRLNPFLSVRSMACPGGLNISGIFLPTPFSAE